MAKGLGARYGAGYFKCRRYVKVHNGAELANDSNRAEAAMRVDVTMHEFSRWVIRYAHVLMATRSHDRLGHFLKIEQ